MLDATPLLRLYVRRRSARLARQDAREAQRRELLRLIRRARSTAFGREHGFSAIATVGAFQERVPLRRYDDFWRDYWQSRFPVLTDICWPGTIPYFALTSGTTTGKTKYIPVSAAMNASNRHAALEILVHHLRARPASRVLAGRNFMLGGSTALKREAPGIFSGDLSGIAANEVPFWARPRFFPPARYALISDWEAKIDALARLSLKEDIRSLSGTPSWVLLFFARLAELRPELPRHSASYFPHLELFIHGGVNFAPYRRQFDALFEGSRIDMREVYSASEGFIGIADRSYGEGLRLIVDGGVFYEFVPVAEIDAANPTRHWLGSVERDVNYAIVLSTCAGLWSYVLGDTVRFVDTDPPRLLVTGRLSYSLSAFGEHLIGEEIEAAVEAAAASIGGYVVDYTVATIYPSRPQERGGHLFIVEFAARMEDAALSTFARRLDEMLCGGNQDYYAHRSGDFGMAAPRVAAVAPGSFAAWLKVQGRIGGQNKVPRVLSDPAIFRSLREFLERGGRIYSGGLGP
jgi:hypothetical protein